jgi:hypothetical protein
MKILRIVGLVGVMVAAPFHPGATFAGHDEPAKAKRIRFDLINSYYGHIGGCQSPNTQTVSHLNGAPACTPAIPSAFFGCAFTPAGSGQFTVVVTGNVEDGSQDIKVSAVAKGLNANCENETLCVTLDFRATTDDCAEGSCTTVDVADLPLPFPFCCTVSGGACRIRRTSLTTGYPGFLLSNRNTGIELLGCGLQPLFPLLSGNAVSCGIVLK